jgi:serine/threonine-protein phosphatase Stp1
MHDPKAEFQSVGRTHAGRVRACNEDSLVERADLGLWAVSDGMGGHRAGDVASALVVEHISRVDQVRPGSFPERVRKAILEANSELYRRGSLVSEDATMGATVTALGAEDSKFFCLWAGDSRLYRFRDGKLARLTRDHRYIQDLLDSGILQESEAESHPRRSVITRAVGIDPNLKLDILEGDFLPGDVFMLATDGVTGVIRDDELARILGGTNLGTVADRIVSLCLQRGAPDNLTLIIVKRYSA